MSERKPVRPFASALLALSVGAAAWGCGGGRNQNREGAEAYQPSTEVQGEAPGKEAMEPGESAAAPMTVHLAPKNGSKMTGTAELRHVAGDSLEVTVTLDSAVAGMSYPVHIHAGSCSEGGPVAVGLESVAAQTAGAARSVTRFGVSRLTAGQSYFVQAHGEGGKPISCGDLGSMAEQHEGGGMQPGDSSGGMASPDSTDGA